MSLLILLNFFRGLNGKVTSSFAGILLYSYAYCGCIRHLATSSLYNGNHRNFTFLVSFRSAMVLCQRMKLVCNVAIVVGCFCLPFSANEVTSVHVLFCLFKSICSCSSSPCYMIM